MPLSAVTITSVLSSSPAFSISSSIRPKVAVEPLDLDAVVEDVGADLGRVGEERGDHDVLEPLARLQARALLVLAVRLVSAVPEAERLVLGRLARKSAKFAA